MKRKRFSRRLCEVVTIGCAWWTLTCYAVVVAGGNTKHLAGFAALALCPLALLFRWLLPDSGSLDRPAQLENSADSSPHKGLVVLWFATSVLSGLLLLPSTGVVTQWWWMVGALAGAVVLTWPAGPLRVEPKEEPGDERWLIGLAVGAALLALVAHRWDPDDTFYVNVAVAAADMPGRALLSGDTLHGIDGLPLHLVAHRFHAYELFVGVLSYLTGTPAIPWFHFVFTALFGAMIPLALATVFRIVLPRFWLAATLVCLIVLLGGGDTHRWYGNFALVRIWQGKSIFLSVFLPLIYAYGLEFSMSPTRYRWMLLMSAQVASIGFTSSALWGAPVAAFFALLAALRPTREGLRVLAVGCASSAIVVGAAIALRGELQSLVATIEPSAPGRALDLALDQVLGDSRLRCVALLSIATGWFACPPGLGRRFASVAPLAAVVLFLNPYASQWIAAHSTGPSYWRALWILPTSITMTALLLLPRTLVEGRGGRWTRGCAVLLPAAVFVMTVPQLPTMSPGNRVRLGPPALKVPMRDYRWAVALNRSVSTGDIVVAPQRVGDWLTTLHHHAHPLQVRWYLERNAAFRDQAELSLRESLMAQAAGEAPHEPASFKEGLRRFDVKAVCLRNSPGADALRATLETEGFAMSTAGGPYEIWTRIGPSYTEDGRPN